MHLLVSVLLLALTFTGILVSSSLVPLDLTTCNSSAAKSYNLTGNSTTGYEASWGGDGATQCYANLVGNLSQVYSFAFYLDYNSYGGPVPSNVFGYVFEWPNPAKFFVSLPVPTDELLAANGTFVPNFVPVTATFAQVLSLNASNTYLLALCENGTTGTAFSWNYAIDVVTAGTYCNDFPANCNTTGQWQNGITSFHMSVNCAAPATTTTTTTTTAPPTSNSNPTSSATRVAAAFFQAIKNFLDLWL